MPTLNVTSKNQLSKTKLRYDMQLSGPDHMAIYIRPLADGKVSSWSFHWTPLRMNWDAPYFIYFSYGVNGDPLKFWLEIEVRFELNTLGSLRKLLNLLSFTERIWRLEYSCI